MNKSKSLYYFLFVVALVVVVPFYCMKNEIAGKQEVRQAWDRYRVISRQDGTLPFDPNIINIKIDGDHASVALEINPPNSPKISGIAEVLRENNLWKVDKVNWDTDILAIAVAKPAQAPAKRAYDYAPPPTATHPMRDPNIRATAGIRVLLDNEDTAFDLATSTLSQTRVDNPNEAVLEFFYANPKTSETRHIVLHLNIARTGFQITDDDKVKLEYKQADKTFVPVSACLVEVSKIYTGDSASELSGKIKDCDIYSGDLTYRLLVEFLITGSLTPVSDPKR